MGTIVVASLDGGRFGWTGPIRAWAYAVSLVVYLVSYFVMYWAMWVNEFFSTVVRIQTERGHRVVTEGPYKYVRHPGYVAGIFLMLSYSLVLGSLWGLAPVGIGTILIIWRTHKEDKMLRMELAGYQEYAAKVKYKLIPHVW
jgi:protein-S-isoprenylcysteine O-methyltransferase Ste14